ncbi:MAG: hypothetical protein OQJ89_09840, partial [Kangiellaceae bacterium]|nr:hypothetical protein [Kangiellaceae bacterium]
SENEILQVSQKLQEEFEEAHKSEDKNDEEATTRTRVLGWKSKVTYVSLSALVTSVLTVSLFWFMPSLSKKNSNFNIASTPYKPLTHLDGIEFYPMASPDGRWIVFNYREKGSRIWQVYLKDLRTEELIPLTTGRYSDKYPKWSANGKQITFTRFGTEQCQFMIAELDVEKRKLQNFSELKTCNPKSLSAQAVLWNDNKGMYYVEEQEYASPLLVYSYSFDSKYNWQVTSPSPTSKGDYFVQLSHSGLQLAVLRSKNNFATEIWIYQTDNWENKLVDTVNTPLFRVNWSADDKSLIYKNDRNQIVKTRITDRTKELLAEVPLPFYSPIILNQTEESLAIVLGTISSAQVVKSDLKTNSQSVLVRSAFQERLAATSKDGKQIAWVSNRTGLPQIWSKQENGVERKLTDLKKFSRFSSLSYSPDGKMLGGVVDGHYFTFNLDTQLMLWSDNKVATFTNFEWRSGQHEFFVTKNQHGHRTQLVVDAFSNQIKVFDKAPDAYLVKESLDGRFLYTWNINTRQITRIDLFSDTKYVFEMKTDLARTNQWCMTSRGLLFSRQLNDHTQLVLIEHTSDSPEIIIEKFNSRTVSTPSDGQWILTTQNSAGNTELVKL